jgi:Ca2+/Na+ antiporter
MISNQDTLFVICLLTFAAIAFTIIIFYKSPKKMLICFILIFIFLLFALFGYYLNKEINNLNNNQNNTDVDLKIIDNYLLTISPWIPLGDINQNPIVYPGIYT